MITRSHYDRDTLARFLDEAAPENDSDIAIHLEQCYECQSTLESLLGEGLTMDAAGELLRDRGVEDLTIDRPDVEHSTDSKRLPFLEPSDHPDSLGRFARFEIMEILGRGGMGIVMRGYDTSLNRHSAVKVLAPELATNAAARRRFSREAKSAAAVVHPHVVPIQTVDDHNGLPYLVMPVVEGQSVDSRVRNTGPVQVIEAVRIASQIAEGLAAAHAQGLVHRDIKPANVLLENGVERVQITDFGLARAIDDASMTRSGVIAGTPQYMSPEQAHGDSIDHRSDLFSLGSLIYFMLTGHSPFRAETTMGVLNRIGNEQPRSLRSINADIPEWFEQIVMKLLAKPREDRIQSATEVAELLQRWHAHLQQPDAVERPSEPTALAAGNSQPLESAASVVNSGIRRWLVGLAAFGFLAVAGVMIVLELDKGRLTIESEADNVPIRIMQGDEVVKKLTVTKAGKSIRVASGKYVILIDGEFSDIHVESGTVTLGSRETKAVRIVRSQESSGAFANPNSELSPAQLAGVLTPAQIIVHGQQVSKYTDAPITTQFRVGSVKQQQHYADSEAWYLCSSDMPSELGVGFFKVWISPAVESALKGEGIADFEKHFVGKTLSISGQVVASAVMLFGRPNIWVYSMELETLDQLTVLESPIQPLSTAVPDYDRPLSFIFYGPKGLKVQLGPVDEKDSDKRISNGPCPCPFKLVSSMVHGVHLSDLPGMPGYSLTCKLEIRRIEESLYRRLSRGEQIRVDFTDTDFEQILSGDGFTKVIYVPSKSLKSAIDEKLKPETLDSSRVEPSVDVVAKAESLGKVIAILRWPPPNVLKQESTTGKSAESKQFNTPTVLAALRGRWQELDHEEGPEFNQTLVFSGGALGQWYEREATLPISITYYVEGNELILQFNHEPEAAFDYRLKQLRFEYELDGDLLSLTRDGVTTRLQRIRDANAETALPKTGAPLQTGPAYQDSSPAFGAGAPTPLRTLTDHVDAFNQLTLIEQGALSQPPLTVDELLCFARWKLETDDQLTEKKKQLFSDIGIGRWLPAGWSIVGGKFGKETSDGEIGAYRIQLLHRESNEAITVRLRYDMLELKAAIRDLESPRDLLDASADSTDETAMPLEAAITEFNAMHNKVDGLRQPPITLEEVLAAIVDWKNRRNEAPVDNRTFAIFQEIAKTRHLPADTKFEVLSSFGSAKGDTFRIWSVRILMPQVAKPGWTYAFTIREQYLSVATVGESEIHWGKPNDDGLQAGFRLIPDQRVYQVGQKIETEFFYRSILGKTFPATLPNIFSHRKLLARDAEGNDLNVVEHPIREVAGARRAAIGETPTRIRGMPLELGYITPDPQHDSISPQYTYLTVKEGQKIFLTYVVSDFGDGELHTGELAFDIAETAITTN